MNHIKNVCRDLDPCSYLIGKGNKLGSKVKHWAILSCLGYNSGMHWWIFKISWHKCSWQDNVPRLRTMLIPQRSRSQTLVKGKKREHLAVSRLLHAIQHAWMDFVTLAQMLF